MPSTYTSRLRFEKPGNGEQAGTWGTTANTDYDLIDQGIAGVVTVTHDNAANYTLTSLSGASDEARNMALVITGTLTANRNVIIPSTQKLYLIRNATSGGFTVTIKTSGGIGLPIPNGYNQWCFCDGVNVYEGTPAYNPTTGAFVGNVGTADKWTTARTLSLSGDASGSVTFDGSANATLALTIPGLAEAGVQSVSLAGTTPRAGTVSITEADTVNILLGGNVVRLFNGRTGSVSLTSTDVSTALGFSPVQSFNTRSGAVTLLAADVTSALGATAVQNATNATNAVNLTGTITGDKVTSAVANATNAANATLAATATTANQLKGKAVATPVNPTDNGKFLQYVSASDSFILSTVSAGGGGTVTSVAVSGGTTGLTTSGGPITSSGTITIAGTLAVANGGTGATTASGARTALGAAASGTNSDITSITGLTTALSVGQGGTGATTATAARTALSAAASGAVTGSGLTMTSARLLGRTTASTGAIEELSSVSVSLGGTGTTTGPSQGGIIYGGSTTAYASTAAGTAGQMLKSNGTAAPTWATLSMTDIPAARFKAAVKLATTANITLSGAQTIDGISAVVGDRVLVKNQTTATTNGIYTVSDSAWTRATDADTSDEVSAAVVSVASGTTNGGTVWMTPFKSTQSIGTADMPWYKMLTTYVTDTVRFGQDSTDTPGSGNTTEGATIAPNGTAHFSSNNGAAAYVAMVNRSGDGTSIAFNRNGTGIGTISVSSTQVSYNATSDYRLKDELPAVVDALGSVNSVPTRRFSWKLEPERIQVGFFAHELQPVVPEAVTGQKDAVDAAGAPIYQMVDYSKLVPILWAAVQELSAKVAALEAAR